VTHHSDRLLHVASLARVEGEGAMLVRVDGDRVTEVQLNIYEAPRFFEALLRGRAYTEPPDITSRICGICPVAYQTSACRAIENALGVTVDGPLADLRRLLYCAEWVESHTMHIYLLHAPDFLGCPDVVTMARDHRSMVERGLAIKKTGNDLIALLAGRPIHPVNVQIGGFYSAPTPESLREMLPRLRQARADALSTVEWVAGFDFPEFEQDHELLALVEPGTYAIESGTPTTDRGLSFPVRDFDRHVIEGQVPHSTALHGRLAGRGRYLTGPLARYTLNHQWLSPLAAEAARNAGLGERCDNPFRSIVVRAVEVLYALDEAVRLIEAYQPPPAPVAPVTPRAGTGYGATEAPRGLLYHRYELGADGTVVSARIVPPTAQNQAAIEEDLCRFVTPRLDLSDERLTYECEQMIRGYDPCISCSTHFLDLRIERGAG
jgi:sulfhydrogenase subunit alpha